MLEQIAGQDRVDFTTLRSQHRMWEIAEFNSEIKLAPPESVTVLRVTSRDSARLRTCPPIPAPPFRRPGRVAGSPQSVGSQGAALATCLDSTTAWAPACLHPVASPMIHSTWVRLLLSFRGSHELTPQPSSRLPGVRCHGILQPDACNIHASHSS